MRVKNFAGFMKNRMNESMMDDQWEPGSEGSGEFEEGDDATSGYYGANPEEDEDQADDEDGEGEEELTLEDLKSTIDDLSERLKKLEPEEEEEEEGGEEEDAEGEEGEEGEEEDKA